MAATTKKKVASRARRPAESLRSRNGRTIEELMSLVEAFLLQVKRLPEVDGHVEKLAPAKAAVLDALQEKLALDLPDGEGVPLHAPQQLLGTNISENGQRCASNT